jgi:hypothetical protein
VPKSGSCFGIFRVDSWIGPSPAKYGRSTKSHTNGTRNPSPPQSARLANSKKTNRCKTFEIDRVLTSNTSHLPRQSRQTTSPKTDLAFLRCGGFYAIKEFTVATAASRYHRSVHCHVSSCTARSKSRIRCDSSNRIHGLSSCVRLN